MERQAAAELDGDFDDHWLEGVADLGHDSASVSLAAEDSGQQPPLWPIRRVTPGMKRCAVAGAEHVGIFFGDLVSDEPDPWTEANLDVDVKAAIQEALGGATPLFLVADSDGLTPHYGRVTVTCGAARLVLWEGGGSVCDDTIAATGADVVLSEVRDRALRLLDAYPTQPNVAAELAERFGAPATPWSPDPARRCKKHRSPLSAPRRCAACRARQQR